MTRTANVFNISIETSWDCSIDGQLQGLHALVTSQRFSILMRYDEERSKLCSFVSYW